MNLLNGRIITKDKILKLSAIIEAKEPKSEDTGFSILIFTYTRLLRLLPTAEKATKKKGCAAIRSLYRYQTFG